MYCELLKENFLQMSYNEQAKRSLIDLCRQEYADNKTVLRVIDEFDRDYEKHSPTWWYTRDCFIYRMLNKALRTYDIEMINRFGFFIKDLHLQLQDLHRALPSGNFTVYRGQRWVRFVKLLLPSSYYIEQDKHQRERLTLVILSSTSRKIQEWEPNQTTKYRQTRPVLKPMRYLCR